MEDHSNDPQEGAPLSPSQCRRARLSLGWPTYRLAAKANVSETTVRRFEQGDHIPKMVKIAAICGALEKAAIESASSDYA